MSQNTTSYFRTWSDRMESQITWIITTLAISISLVFMFMKRSFSYWKRRNVPYLTPTIPFGNLENPITSNKPQFLYVREFYEKFKKMRVQYGGVYIYTSPMFLTIDPKYNKEILIRNFQYFHARGFYSTKHQPVSENLFTKDGDKWSILRTKFTPMFTPSKLKGMFDLMIEATKPMLKYITEHHCKQIPLNAKNCATRFTTDVTATCVFGFESNSFVDETLLKQLNEILVKSTRLLRVLFCIALPKVANFLRIPLLPPAETDVVCRNLEESVNYRTQNNIIKMDFLQLLIDIKNQHLITLTELKAQCLLFLIGGYETTAATISFMLLELANNEVIQEKLRTEFNEILSSYGGEILYEAVMEMKYLEMVLCGKFQIS